MIIKMMWQRRWWWRAVLVKEKQPFAMFDAAAATPAVDII